jgi:hypothetical protein
MERQNEEKDKEKERKERRDKAARELFDIVSEDYI